MKNTPFIYKRQLFIPILGLLWALAICLVNPLGDFPLNDDFSYGRTVYNLSEQGILEFDDWLAMTLITQVFWGASFCKVFGFSFTVLRFSTLILGYFGIVVCYLIAKEMGQKGFVPAIIAAVVAFNPLYFSLSFTFMTDVPFFFLLCLSLYFYVKFFSKDQLKWFVLANVFAVAAIFIRQLGLLLPISFCFVWLLGKKRDIRNLALAILPLAFSITLYVLYMNWFKATYGIPEELGTFPKLFKRLGHENFLKACLERVGLLFIYLGLFLLPLNLFLLKWPRKKKEWIILLAISVVALITTFSIWNRFPYGNILYNLGLGPKLLKDGVFFINVEPQLPSWAMKIVAMIGIVGAILLIINLMNKAFAIKKVQTSLKMINAFAATAIVLYGGFLMLNVLFFDRYFLTLLPFGFLLLFPLRRTQKVKLNFSIELFAAFLTLLLMAIFSIAATHDLFSWNRARWQALDHLTDNMSISPHQIDGGFEFNGWHRPVKDRTYGEYKSWWWVDQDDYVVSFGDLGGFHKIDTFLFRTYLPPTTDTIFILKKN